MTPEDDRGRAEPSSLLLAREIAVLRTEVSDLEEAEEAARGTALRWSVATTVAAIAGVAYVTVALGPASGGAGLLVALFGASTCATLWYRYIMARDRTVVRRGELALLVSEEAVADLQSRDG
jgi:hypothetical protein